MKFYPNHLKVPYRRYCTHWTIYKTDLKIGLNFIRKERFC